jgi:hypothetical protein
MYGGIILVNKKIIPEDLSDSLSLLLKKTSDSLSVKRIQCIYFKAKYDKTPEEIADMVGYNVDYVKHIQANFWKNGESAFKIKLRGGRNNSIFTVKEEKNLIDKFEKEATQGRIVEVSKIHKVVEEKAKKKVAQSTTYRMLDRNNWRKVVPRPYHPKSNKKKEEDFKKTSNI